MRTTRLLLIVLVAAVVIGGGYAAYTYLMPDAPIVARQDRPSVPSTPTVPPAAPIVDPSLKPITPVEGLLWRLDDQNADSRFTVSVAPGKLAYLIQMFKEPGHQVAMLMYVGPGQTHTATIASGSYQAEYAFGEQWYGFPTLFGPKTLHGTRDQYLRFENNDKSMLGQQLKFGSDVPASTPVGQVPVPVAPKN